MGTEIPLTAPAGVTASAAWEGAFTRIEKKFPPDYYWHWTPEGWEWGKTGVNSTTTKQALSDLLVSIPARTAAGANFTFATCGWELGPVDDKSYFDDVLPVEVEALSSIDQRVGWSDVDPVYAEVKREKWVIPWMEDDPHLIGSELWANRPLDHVRDAKKYGATGVLGIHWRTLETSLTIRAMAESSWADNVTVEGLYLDFTTNVFGPAAAKEAADIFVSLDSWLTKDWTAPPSEGCVDCSSKMPSSGFTCCAHFTPPASLIDLTPFAFADSFFALRPTVAAQPNSGERLRHFDEWAYQFRYHRSIAEFQNTLFYLNENMTAIKALPTAAQRKTAAQTQGLAALSAASRSYELLMDNLLT